MPKIIELSDTIHAFKETAFQEHKSAQLLINYLENVGFSVERKAAGLDTSFVAISKDSRPRVAFMAEFDALPEIGHGCGHNLIGASSVAAGVAVKALQDGGYLSGSVSVIGCPAEEGGGGKIHLLNNGVLENVDFSMMVHPSPGFNFPDDGCLALISFYVEFFGKPAHIQATPQMGANALEALLSAFNGINSLRYSFIPEQGISGIIKKGGEGCGVVPDYTKAEFFAWADDMPKAELLFNRVKRVIEGASRLSFCTCKVIETFRYKEMVPNVILRDLFQRNAETLGRLPLEGLSAKKAYSTDQGDVSHVVPALHPMFGIEVQDGSWHSPAAHEAAKSKSAHDMMCDSAKALCHTAIDVIAIPGKLDEVKASFQKDKEKAPNFAEQLFIQSQQEQLLEN